MTKDDIIRMAVEAGFATAPFWPDDFKGLHGCAERFANLVAAAERESLVDAIETANARSKMRLPDIIVLILSRSQS
jgi:hypothetical protein